MKVGKQSLEEIFKGLLVEFLKDFLILKTIPRGITEGSPEATEGNPEGKEFPSHCRYV